MPVCMSTETSSRQIFRRDRGIFLEIFGQVQVDNVHKYICTYVHTCTVMAGRGDNDPFHEKQVQVNVHPW